MNTIPILIAFILGGLLGAWFQQVRLSRLINRMKMDMLENVEQLAAARTRAEMLEK